MFFAPLLLAVLGQTSETVLDPRISEVSVFKPGLAYVIREATVPAGLHEFRLKVVPQAMDGTLWYDSPDGVKLSELRTTINMNSLAPKKPVTGIDDLLSGSIGKTVEIKVRPNTQGAQAEAVKGKLLSFDQQRGAIILQPNHHLRAVGAYEIVDVNTDGLSMTVQRKHPRIEIRFRVDAARQSRIRFYSLEMGAAWVANYRLKLTGTSGELESEAQLGLGSLSLTDSRVRLVSGIPSMDTKTRSDLATGSSSLGNYLANRAGTLSQSASDPFEAVENAMQRGGMGGGMGGGGLVGESIDFVSYDPSDNSLVVRPFSEAPQFLTQAVEASRLEDLHIYPFGNVTLPAGGRITRVLSTKQVPLSTVYIWNVDANSAFQRVLRMHNANDAGWPAGTVLLQDDGVPIAQVPMLFTAAGQDANLALGTAEDLLHKSQVVEVERHQGFDPQNRRLVEIIYKATIEATNTRNEALDIEVNFPVTGTVSDSGGSVISKGVTRDPLNPANILTWRLKIQPDEHKVWNVTYKTVIL